MTWLSSIGRALDPTRAGSVIRRGLRQLDPTLKSSAVAGIGRQLDVTNKNSIAGKVAPYAVGLIPGVGAPLAMALGAGLGAAQAVGRHEDLGGIASSALGGASKAGITRSIARAVMPGTFAPTAQTAAGIAPAPGTGALASGPRLDVPLNSTATWDAQELANIAANNAPPPIPRMAPYADALVPMSDASTLGQGATSFAAPSASELESAASGTVRGVANGAGRSTLGSIGSFLTRQPTTIPSLLGTGATIYGASQVGKAEDARLRMEQELYDEEKQRRANRIGFDDWRARKYLAPGSASTV